MNRLFVVDKPIFISSNKYINHIKRKYHTKKVGYSGTLDPFATGCLIVATGQYTKLFRFLKKSPKVYQATLWLGANSDTLDIESISKIEETSEVPIGGIEKLFNDMVGEIKYLPPKYSAKKINGQRACDMARSGKDIQMSEITSTIYDIKLLNYNHPFLHFEISVSEGAYIRSIASIIAKKLNMQGALSSLKRVKEGEFIYQDEKPLNPIDYLTTTQNFYLGDIDDIKLGKKLSIDKFKIQKDGIYHIILDDFFSIIEIDKSQVKYLLNKIALPKGELWKRQKRMQR